MEQSHWASGLLLLPVLLLAVAVISVPLGAPAAALCHGCLSRCGRTHRPLWFRPGAGARDHNHSIRARRSS